MLEDSLPDDVNIVFTPPVGLKSILQKSPPTSSKNLTVNFEPSVNVIYKDTTEVIPITEEDIYKKPPLSRTAMRRQKAKQEYEKVTLPELPQDVMDFGLQRSTNRSPPPELEGDAAKIQSDTLKANYKKGNLIKNGVEREVILKSHTLYYTHKNKKGGKTIPLLGDIQVKHTLPSTIKLIFPFRKEIQFRSKTPFESVEWYYAIVNHVKKTPDPHLCDWLEGYGNSVEPEMVILEGPEKKRKKKRKKLYLEEIPEKFNANVNANSTKSSTGVESADKILREKQQNPIQSSRRRRKKRTASHEDKERITIRKDGQLKQLVRASSADGNDSLLIHPQGSISQPRDTIKVSKGSRKKKKQTADGVQKSEKKKKPRAQIEEIITNTDIITESISNVPLPLETRAVKPQASTLHRKRPKKNRSSRYATIN